MHYQKLGLKCGLEIHRQLSSEKLFCPCSTAMKEKPLKFTIKRNLRAVAGEREEVDVAALAEMKKGKDIVYHGFEDEACLVCTDSEPPHEINQEALETALSVATLLKLKIPSFLQPMRKTIVDGSACSGFQRTMLVGIESKNSYLETSAGKVKINLLCLEEDASKIIKKEGNEFHYSLSRQGIPLLELATNPDIKSPKQALEVATKIGSLLASFSSIKRGLGTIRQDVNVSIKKGARVEIKGVQNLRQIPLIIEKEIQRQLGLIKNGKKLKLRVKRYFIIKGDCLLYY